MVRGSSSERKMERKRYLNAWQTTFIGRIRLVSQVMHKINQKYLHKVNKLVDLNKLIISWIFWNSVIILRSSLFG